MAKDDPSERQRRRAQVSMPAPSSACPHSAGAALASNLYTAHFTDGPLHGTEFESNVDLLFERIVDLTRAKLRARAK